MIVGRGLSKRYMTAHGAGPWVLDDVSFVIPPRVSVGILGANGAGKSTLLRILAGVDKPTRGAVERHCRVSWPLGFGGGLQGSMTGRQNARFVCRIHGHEDDIPERLDRIAAFAALGDKFDQPIRTYSTGMAARCALPFRSPSISTSTFPMKRPRPATPAFAPAPPRNSAAAPIRPA
jgi:capsular polysaccharide transport system ATP-binding protein